jgi:hypothetical protein
VAWIFNAASTPIYLANVVVGLVVFNNPSYVHQGWHTTLIMLGFIVIPLAWNFYFRRLAIAIEWIGAICHFATFIASIIVLAVMGQWGNSKYVWKTLTHDQSGWTDPAICWGIGLITLTLPLSGESVWLKVL